LGKRRILKMGANLMYPDDMPGTAATKCKDLAKEASV
jgi:hypothetical protein